MTFWLWGVCGGEEPELVDSFKKKKTFDILFLFLKFYFTFFFNDTPHLIMDGWSHHSSQSRTSVLDSSWLCATEQEAQAHAL